MPTAAAMDQVHELAQRLASLLCGSRQHGSTAAPPVWCTRVTELEIFWTVSLLTLAFVYCVGVAARLLLRYWSGAGSVGRSLHTKWRTRYCTGFTPSRLAGCRWGLAGQSRAFVNTASIAAAELRKAARLPPAHHSFRKLASAPACALCAVRSLVAFLPVFPPPDTNALTLAVLRAVRCHSAYLLQSRDAR